MDLSVVLTSAGVAALVSSGVTFLNQQLERRARRDELPLSKALELAYHASRSGVMRPG